jgi:hypothetical protein
MNHSRRLAPREHQASLISRVRAASVKQLAQFTCFTTAIFSSAIKYSTTISYGTGPYSAETASRISCAFPFPAVKLNTSYAYCSPLPHTPLPPCFCASLQYNRTTYF